MKFTSAIWCRARYGSVSYKTKQCKSRPKDQWYVVRGTHEPIIDQELWDKVCRRRAERSRPFSDGKIGIFALQSTVRILRLYASVLKTRDRHYLQCPNRHISVEACPGAFIAVSHLEEAVLEELNRMAQEFLDKDEAAESVAFCKNLQKQKKCLQREDQHLSSEAGGIYNRHSQSVPRQGKGTADRAGLSCYVERFCRRA